MAEPLILRFDVKDDGTAKVKALSGELNKLGGQIRKTEGASKKFDTGLKGLRGSLGKLRSVALSAKGALAGLGVGLGLGAAFREISAFDRAIGETAAVARATTEEFKALTEAARNIGSSTQFSATQAAQGLNVLVRAGFDAKSSITVLDQAVAGATVAGTDLQRILTIATDALAIFSLEAGETGRVIDALTAADIAGKTSIDELGQAISDVGPILNKVGIDIETTSAALAILSNRGITGGEAGRTLRAVFLSLLNPSKELENAIKQVGLTLDDFNPLVTDTATILDNLGRFNPEQLAAGFGRFEAVGVAALAGTGEELRNLTGEIRNSRGITDELAGEIGDDLTGAFDRFKSAVSDLILTLGDAGLRDLFRLALEAATDLFNELSNNKDAFQPLRDFADFAKANFPALKSILRTSIVIPFQIISERIQFAVRTVKLFLTAISPLTSLVFRFTGLEESVSLLEDLALLGRSVSTVLARGFATLGLVFDNLEITIKGVFNSIKQVIQDFINNTVNKAISQVNRLIDALNKVPGVDIGRIAEGELIQFDIDPDFVGVEALNQRFAEARQRLEQELANIDTSLLEDSLSVVGERAGTEYGESFINSLANQLNQPSPLLQQASTNIFDIAAEFGPEVAQQVSDRLAELQTVVRPAGADLGKQFGEEFASAATNEIADLDRQIAQLQRELQADRQLGEIDIALERGQITELQAIQQRFAIETSIVAAQQAQLQNQIALANAAGDVVTAKKLELELLRSQGDLTQLTQGAELDRLRTLKDGVDNVGFSFTDLGSKAKQFFGDLDQETQKFIDTALQLGDALLQAFSIFANQEGSPISGLAGLFGQQNQGGISFSGGFGGGIADTSQQQTPQTAQFFDSFLGATEEAFNNRLPQIATEGVGQVTGTVGSGLGQIGNAWGSGLNALASGTQSGFSAIANAARQILSSLGSSGGGGIGGGGFGIVGLGLQIGSLIGNLINQNRAQNGGLVAGTGRGDKVPALLEPGEFVLTRNETRALGLNTAQGNQVRPAKAGVERAAPAENNVDIINFIDPSAFEQFVTRRDGRETIINMLNEEGVL